MTHDLFENIPLQPFIQCIGSNAFILRGFANLAADTLIADLNLILTAAPLRHMKTSRGFTMSVAMTNCGTLGWVSDTTGYRYTTVDPDSGRLWPTMPTSFSKLATRAAERAGLPNFRPDACLINRYEPGTKLSLHQDKDEKDFREPIVSVSLGVPAIFLFGGVKREDKTNRFQLNHGDVVVWGGASRLYYHGILPIKKAIHCILGNSRVNLTFRKAE